MSVYICVSCDHYLSAHRKVPRTVVYGCPCGCTVSADAPDYTITNRQYDGDPKRFEPPTQQSGSAGAGEQRG